MGQNPPFGDSGQGNSDGVFGCKSKDEVDFFIEDAFARAGLDIRRGIKDDPLSQIYVSVTSHLNDLLEIHIGGTLFDQDRNVLNLSPKEVAEQIMDQVYQFFKSYRDHTSHRTEADAWLHYSSIIQNGVSQGFSEAKDIIESLGGLNPVARNQITQFKEYVVKGLSHLQKK